MCQETVHYLSVYRNSTEILLEAEFKILYQAVSHFHALMKLFGGNGDYAGTMTRIRLNENIEFFTKRGEPFFDTIGVYYSREYIERSK